jgi:hypothetical protein
MESVILQFGNAAIVLAAVGMVILAGLNAWRGWLELKRLEIGHGKPATVGERIEIADLRERIRKLESIAACVDL